MANDSQPLEQDCNCNEFSELLDNSIATIIPLAMKQNEINDKTHDSTIPWLDQSSLDDISTSTKKSQKGTTKKKATCDPAYIDTSNLVQAKRKLFLAKSFSKNDEK